MKLSASQAAKETGKSIPTITRAIKSGRLSAVPADPHDKGKGWEIDPAELFRVFPPLTPASNDTHDKLGIETPNSASALEAEIKMLHERLADKDDVIDDLRKRLDAESEERRKLTMILTDQRPVPAPAAVAERPRRVWWPFSRSND